MVLGKIALLLDKGNDCCYTNRVVLINEDKVLKRQTRLYHLKDYSCAYRYKQKSLFCSCELPNCPSYLSNYQVIFEVGNNNHPDRYRVRLHDGGIIVCNAYANVIGYSLANGDCDTVIDQFNTLEYLDNYDVLTLLGNRLRNLATVANRKLANKARNN